MKRSYMLPMFSTLIVFLSILGSNIAKAQQNELRDFRNQLEDFVKRRIVLSDEVAIRKFEEICETSRKYGLEKLSRLEYLVRNELTQETVLLKTRDVCNRFDREEENISVEDAAKMLFQSVSHLNRRAVQPQFKRMPF